MSFVTIKRVVRAGFLDFWRNGFVSLSSILVMTVTLFIMGITIFAGVILSTTLDQLRDKADISVYFTTTASPEKIIELQKSVEVLPQVRSVQFISAQDALAAFRNLHQNDQLTLQSVELVGGNPLGARLNVRAQDISQYEAIGKFLQQQQSAAGNQSIIDRVNYSDTQTRVALDNLRLITDSAQRLGLIVVIILIVTTLAISYNTLSLAIYTSREEIQIMRLVGAGQFYIRAPFMIEGLLYGLIAGLLTLALFFPLTYYLGHSTANFFGGLNVFKYYLVNFPTFFFTIVGTGITLGVVASFLAVRRYLKI